MDQAISVRNVRKRYGDTLALDDVSLDVRRGEIFGIVGPNGAGKTTLVSIATGLRSQDSGELRVLGLNPQRQERALRERIGIQLQEAALQERIKVHEALRLYASFYARPVPWEPLLAQWGLAEKRDAYFTNLSGGQKQRLFIALALINDPELVFLDELTTGLDPQARRLSWDLIREIRERDTTVILVTHSMEEAELLCDRVAVIDHGRLVALDRPAELTRSIQDETRVRFTANAGFNAAALRDLAGVRTVDQVGEGITVTGSGFLMAEVAGALARAGLAPPDLRTERSTMEDVFLRLTGRDIRD